MDLIITILPVVTKDLPISPRFTPYNFLSRCKFSTLTTRQPMVELRFNILVCTGVHSGGGGGRGNLLDTRQGRVEEAWQYVAGETKNAE